MNDDQPVRLKDVRATSPALAHALRALGRSSDLERLGRVAQELEAALAGAPLQPSAAASGGSLAGKWLMVGLLAAGGAAGFWGWRAERERLPRMAAATASVIRSAGSAAATGSANVAESSARMASPVGVAADGGGEPRLDERSAGSAVAVRHEKDSIDAAGHALPGELPARAAGTPLMASRTARIALPARADQRPFANTANTDGLELTAAPTSRAAGAARRRASTARAANASDPTLRSASAATAPDLTLSSASATTADDLASSSTNTADVPKAAVPTPNEPPIVPAAVDRDREAPQTPRVLHERSHSQPPLAAASRAGGERSEAALLLAARKAKPSAALELLAEHATRFPDGLLAPERDVLRIEALRKLGRAAEAERQLRAFEARYPDSLHLSRLVTTQRD